MPNIKAQIFGPPGTGKTTELIKTVENCIREGRSPREIGYIAFTRKAANEAKTRSQEKFNLTADDLPYFRTLHSLAFMQLGLQKHEVMGIRDYYKLAEMLSISITTKGIGEDGTLSGLSKGDRLFFMENMARARNIPLKQYWEENPDEDIYWFELERLHQTLVEYKRINSKMDFTDIVYKFISQSNMPPINVLIVDEAQDLSPIQWKMVDAIAEGCEEVYIAGDDDQAIFRWAGADVNYFINYDATKRVLEQSYRIPAEIQKVADSIITRTSVRMPKQWKPRDEAGSVDYVTDLDQIDMGQGTWLLLARNSYLLDRYQHHCMQMGYVFESSVGSPIAREILDAIKYWETLRKGNPVKIKHVRIIYEQMSTKVGVAYGMKTKMENEHDERIVVMKDLRSDFGLLTEEIWHKALDKLKPTEIEYVISALKRGEKLMKEPRIKINTIHGVKGGEADNVVIQTDMALRTFNEYQMNPDDEHRVWYVAVTRARQRLFIVQPETDRSYQI